MDRLRSVVFTVFLFAWTLCFAIFFVIAGVMRDFPQRTRLVQIYARVILEMLRRLCRLDYTVEGLEHLPAGAHVAYWKHSSSWETFAQFLIGPPKAIVLKRELMWIPIFGWGLALIRSIPVDRGAGASAVNQVVQRGTTLLSEGTSVLIFPEGTRVAPGETRRYGVSGALLASRARCKVVPIAHDAGYYWPRRGWYKRAGTIRVIIGPPIEAAGRDPREINAEAQAWIETTLERLPRERPRSG
jgi:1-acyl-sn-glycerol-3-phosphate acyltransferase